MAEQVATLERAGDEQGTGTTRKTLHDRELTPAERRRPDALPGRLFRLADGQEWELPEVVIEFVPDPSRPDGTGVESNIGPEFDRALLDHDDARVSGGVWIGPALRFASALLRRNYDVDPGELRALIRFSGAKLGDPESLYSQIRDFAVGLDERPKAGEPGWPSASGPTE